MHFIGVGGWGIYRSQVMGMWSLSPETEPNARRLHPGSAYEVKRMSFVVGRKVNVLLEAKVLKQRTDWQKNCIQDAQNV